MTRSSPTAEELFKQIWPEGAPAEELVVFKAVPLGEREEVLRRLEAAWRGEQGEPWDQLAPGIGLQRAAFFNLKKRFRQHGVAGVIPHGAQRGRSVDTPEGHSMWNSAATLLRSKGGTARNVDIARELIGERPQSGKEMAELQRAERLVQHVRRTLALDHQYLLEAYGSGLLIDLTAVSLIVDGPDPSVAVVAVVAETSSGLVLGSSLGLKADSCGLQQAAISTALEFLHAHRADRRPEDKECASLGLTLPPSKSDADLQLDSLRSVVRDLQLGTPGGFSYGQALVQLVGPRIGRMVLAPRRTLVTDTQEYVKTKSAAVLELDHAVATWQREVLRHNGPILAALKATRLVDGAGSPDAAMAAVLRSVATILPAGATSTSQSTSI